MGLSRDYEIALTLPARLWKREGRPLPYAGRFCSGAGRRFVRLCKREGRPLPYARRFCSGSGRRFARLCKREGRPLPYARRFCSGSGRRFATHLYKGRPLPCAGRFCSGVGRRFAAHLCEEGSPFYGLNYLSRASAYFCREISSLTNEHCRH